MRAEFDAILRFLEQGGAILWVILFVAILLLALLAERFWYVRRVFPHLQASVVGEWNARKDHRSWQSLRIREALLSHAKTALENPMPIIRVLVALLPMLGLLGTVVGMINVFDVMALTGSGNARAMASGVSMATIPTMAGMVVALVGLFCVSQLEHANQTALARLNDTML